MNPNPALRSPFDAQADQQAAEVTPVLAAPTPATPEIAAAPLASTPAPAPVAPTPAPAAAKSDNLAPPDDLKGVFEGSAKAFDVPVNVLMALAHQESRYNPLSVNRSSGAEGIMNYMPTTSKGLGINPFDPNEAIPAAAKQLRERLDAGESMAEAVKGHFAGPDRKLWGPKTAAYGDEVLAKAGAIGDLLYAPGAAKADASDDDEEDTPVQAKAGQPVNQNRFSSAMSRPDYYANFMALNPHASPDAIQNAMAQYDVDAAARQKAGTSRVQDKFAQMASPDATFNAKLNAKLQGDNEGLASVLPANAQVASQPAPAAPTSTINTLGANLVGGAMHGIMGAMAAGKAILGDDAGAKEIDDARQQVQAVMNQNGGDTITGKAAALVGGVAPALAAPEGAVAQLAVNAGLFAIPAARDTYKAQIAKGASPNLAIAHAAEAAGINLVMPTVAARGVGAIAGKLGAEGMAGLGGAAAQVGQAAGEGVGFSVVNSVLDKGTDLLAGQQNDNPWLDPQDMAAQALGFGGLRAGHVAAHAVMPGSAPEVAAADLAQARATAPLETAEAAAVQRAAPPGASVADQMRAVRPAEVLAGPLEAAVHSAVPVEQPVASPLTDALHEAAAVHADNPAPVPEMPPAEPPAPPPIETVPMEALRARLKDATAAIKEQRTPELVAERNLVQKEINARGKEAAQETAQLAEEPTSTGPFDTREEAAKMAPRVAEKTATVHEVVKQGDKFILKPQGASDGAVLPQGAADGSRSGADAVRPGPADAAGSQGSRPVPVVDRADAGRPVGKVQPDPVRAAAAEKPVSALSELAGKPIDKQWTAFAKDSGTLGVDRADMPQVKAEHRGALTQFLLARGIAHEQAEMPAGDLKPTQREFSPAKVEQAKAYEGGDRSILVSSDNHILDGHHQWLAKMDANEPVKVIKLDAPIKKLMDEVKEFPSAEVRDGATEAALVNNKSNEPSIADGMTRLYHGGDVGRYDGKAWFSTDRKYAEGYAKKDGRTGAEVQYVDYPTDKINTIADPDGYGQTPAKGFHHTIELSSDETGLRKPLSAVPAEKVPKVVPAKPSPTPKAERLAEARAKHQRQDDAVKAAAENIAKRKAMAEPVTEPVSLSLGKLPNSAEPITVRDGVVHIGEYGVQDYDTGADVKVPNGATPQQIRDALTKAGAIGRGNRIFGMPKEGEAITAKVSKAGNAKSGPARAQEMYDRIGDEMVAQHSDKVGPEAMRSHLEKLVKEDPKKFLQLAEKHMADVAKEGVTLNDITDPKDTRTIEVDGVRRPIRTSDGELVAPTFDSQKEFWRKYAGEVDEKGRPVIERQNDISSEQSRALMDAGPLARMEEPKRVVVLAELKRMQRLQAAGKMTAEAYRVKVDELIGKIGERNAAQENAKAIDKERGPDWVEERLMRAKRQGELDPDTVDFAMWALRKSPALAADLAISLKSKTAHGSAGSYGSAERIMTLLKNGTNDGTAVHEMLHHTERMMPQAIQKGIQKAWLRAYSDAWTKADAPTRARLDDLMAGGAGDKKAFERTVDAFRKGELNYDKHYQLVNASEFWAVNATRIMNGRFQGELGGWVPKAKQWLSEMVQHLKGIVGLKSDSAVMKGLSEVLNGDGKRVSNKMLGQLPVAHDISATPADAEPPDDPGRIEAARAGLARMLKTPLGAIKSAAFNTRMAVVPMTTGDPHAQKIAKDFANDTRKATAQWGAFDSILKKNYTTEQLESMWKAADAENDLRRAGKTSDTEGLNSLPQDQRETVEVLHQYGEALWKKAQDAGMVEGDGVAYWTPRMAAHIVADGTAEGITSPGGEFSKEARNLSTTAKSMKHRAYETTAESEAALKEKMGDGAAYVKNIRVMPLAMAQLERAIAGRTLVNQVKAHGKVVGDDLISDNGGPNFVTIDHPALKQWRPKADWLPADMDKLANPKYEVKADGVYKNGDKLASYKVGADGQVLHLRPVMDETGKPVMQSSPLYVRKDFAGPLKAVFTSEPNKMYQALMELKGAVTSMIMISPLTHNLVIWGKAMPTMVSTMGWRNNLKNAGTLGLHAYFVGNSARGDHGMMNELIGAGLVPVSGRGMNPDIPAIANGIAPGRSLAAKAVGAVLDMASPKAGDIGRKAVDKAGEIWHEKLLWDRVADMQAGMAVMMRTSLMDKGLDQYTSNRIATHFANRYAGMIPKEAMSEGAHMLLNLSLFSKSFTVTNLGAYKDLIGGLPGDIQAQIKINATAVQRALGRDEAQAAKAGDAVLAQAQRSARAKGAMVLALDIGAMTTIASLTQALVQGQSFQQISDDFKERLKKLGIKGRNDPLAVIGHPIDSLASLSQTADNPHGKEDRVRIGVDEHGNSYYARLPVGKVGEELKQYASPGSALHLLHNKMSTFVKPLADIANNQDFTGHSVYQPGDNMAKQIASMASYWVKSQFPLEEMKSAVHLADGTADRMDKAKLLGMATGLSVSKVTGGDVVAEMRWQSHEHSVAIRDVLPQVQEAIRRGDDDKAEKIMEDAGATPQEIRSAIRKIENPDRISSQTMRNFNKRSTEEQSDRVQKLIDRQDKDQQPTR